MKNLVNEINFLLDTIEKYEVSEKHKPKFDIGDKVIITDLKRRGKVTKVLSYDDIINQYQYKVKDKDGQVKTWNEDSLKEA